MWVGVLFFSLWDKVLFHCCTKPEAIVPTRWCFALSSFRRALCTCFLLCRPLHRACCLVGIIINLISAINCSLFVCFVHAAVQSPRGSNLSWHCLSSFPPYVIFFSLILWVKLGSRWSGVHADNCLDGICSLVTQTVFPMAFCYVCLYLQNHSYIVTAKSAHCKIHLWTYCPYFQCLRFWKIAQKV